MRKLFVVLMGLAGWALALYVGLVVMFVGGLIEAINAAKANPVVVHALVWGIVRVLFTGPVIAGIGYSTSFLAYMLGTKTKTTPRNLRSGWSWPCP